VDYILKSNDERVVVNDYIENDPLSENNLDKTLNLVNEFRLSSPQKSIWLYTGYTVFFGKRRGEKTLSVKTYDYTLTDTLSTISREEILKQCNIVVDGKYIDSQRDITFKWRGSSNQRVIDIKKSLEQNEIILYCD